MKDLNNNIDALIETILENIQHTQAMPHLLRSVADGVTDYRIDTALSIKALTAQVSDLTARVAALEAKAAE